MRREFRQHKLLDALIAELELKNDAALAKHLQLQKPVISKIRNKIVPVSAERVLQIHEITGWEVKRIKELAGHA